VSPSVLKDPEEAVARADAFARDPERMEVLRRTELLDAGSQQSLDRFARLAADLTGAPVSLVSLIDEDRQYFAGIQGVDIQQTPLQGSYCKHVIADDVQLSVEDSHLDAILIHNGATTDLGVRAYLGSPVTAGGASLGALCVLDTQPRVWDERQRRVIHDLSLAVSTDIELRLQVAANARMAEIDPLTGLGNRRALAMALERVFTDHRRVFLGMFDLDGFKVYNDSFGHPAGDHLLVRVADRLREEAGSQGEAFRMGGDEFCVISPDRECLIDAQRAIADRGPGFSISACLGIAEIPDEADDVTSAIAVADQRMYGGKAPRQGSLSFHVSEALLRALAERDHSLGGHSDNVSDLARQTAIALGVSGETVRSIQLAGRLHDVGKMAISDSILTKPGPLDAEEWQQMRCHTLIGERILAGTPSLAEAATLVRASHERFDGHGYPDGLAGDEIPLGARIIFACDALDAMISDRAYRAALSISEALEELDRNAGTQFDPVVIRALRRAHEHLAARPVTS
jgi:diguanylate cyclase (GGDEF)-like protein